MAQYYQALADNDANAHGVAIGRLQVAESLAKEANRVAAAFPSSVPANSNLTIETGPTLATNVMEDAIKQRNLDSPELISRNYQRHFQLHESVEKLQAASITVKDFERRTPASLAVDLLRKLNKSIRGSPKSPQVRIVLRITKP